MIINYFDIFGFVSYPFKTNTPLVVDANTILSGTVTLKLLQPISRNHLNIT